jgi:hypothetical protein
MSGITIFAGDSVTFTVKFRLQMYVSVPPPAVIAVKAVCSEVNLPVPTGLIKLLVRLLLERILLLHLENLLQ